MNASNRSTCGLRGFTLLELLVVIAITTVLVTVLMAGLSGSKEAAKRAVCLSQMKGMAQSGIQLAAENKGRFVSIPQTLRALDPTVLECISDDEPADVDAAVVGVSQDLRLSYGFNVEYPLKSLSIDDVLPPSSKLYAYDGFGGVASTSAVTVSGTNNGKLLVNGQFVTLRHQPPGNPNNAHEITIGAPAAQAHIDHGDAVVGFVAGEVAMDAFILGDFARRHLFERVGNVVFADGHGASFPALLNSMFMYSTGAAEDPATDGGDSSSKGNGNNGNGNGNNGNNGKGKGNG